MKPSQPDRPSSDERNIFQVTLNKAMRPLEEFVHKETSSGIILLLAVVAAMILANSPYLELYDHLLHTSLTIGVPGFSLSYSLHHWINDGLMALFFFVVGLEVKREILIGELSILRQALLPIAMAIGGMIMPALFYLFFNQSGEAVNGWGIPMATDIAFALGIVALLGSRVSPSLIALLLAVAIVDDLGAVMVIAAFYTETIHFFSLLLAAASFLFLVFINLAGIRHPLPYIVLGGLMWLAMMKSGVHATLAGVLTALTIPARSSLPSQLFADHLSTLTARFQSQISASQENPRFNVLRNAEKQRILQSMEDSIHHMESPLQRIEHSMHGWVAFIIVPIFAFANAGIPIDMSSLPEILSQGLTLGILAGLIGGKTVGITLACWLTVKSGLSRLPKDVTPIQIVAIALLAGIGFTMSIFIATLAFAGNNQLLLSAKIGILVASLLAGIGGYFLLLISTREK